MERLGADERLRRSADYLHCYRKGRRRNGRLLILYFLPNQVGLPRLGITASRKVGIAVRRGQAKRRVREIFRRSPQRPLLAPLDLVVHLQPGSGGASFSDLSRELSDHLRYVTQPSRGGR